ncbi:MAG: hypothetical protein C0601_09835 [Candidatus Muiribacterium halophilum]|uniref:BPL/LPL catalytic domain-containing protein n=1 Tax=Muiribacterium halophilum TaxID=2053465 RepID=A0A2N5ZD88_MUIH1|nr:MAG: hypothetical protein C0601_09835 [Candidatus Muirbacterium halophilum]
MKAIYYKNHKSSAAFNMAADLFMKERAHDEDTIFLSFYHWDTPTFSIGKFQDDSSLKEIARKNGFGIIRRPTGGRTVVHQNDLTYSFCAPIHIFEDKSIKGIYKKITSPFIKVFKEMFEDTKFSDAPSKDYHSKVSCFDSLSLYEVKIDGKKALGSAQYKDNDSVLQHGSMYIRLPEVDDPQFSFKNVFSCVDFYDEEFREKVKVEFEKEFGIKFETKEICSFSMM